MTTQKKVYRINGREIHAAEMWSDKNGAGNRTVETVINELLEALSDKEEKCKWCKAGIPENCVEQSDLAETVARLDKQALKDSEMHEIEIPRPTYSDKEECDCKEKSCKPDCTTKHTCHVYSCEKCNPEEQITIEHITRAAEKGAELQRKKLEEWDECVITMKENLINLLKNK